MTEIRSKRRAYTKKSKKSQRTTRRRVRGGELSEGATNRDIPIIEPSVKTGGRAVLSQKYVIYGFSKDDRFYRGNRNALLDYKGKVEIKIMEKGLSPDNFTLLTMFTDMKTFLDTVDKGYFKLKISGHLGDREQKIKLLDKNLKTEIYLTQYITFNEDNGRKMLIQLYYWAEDMKRLIDAQNKARRFRNDYNRLKTEPHGSRENEETILREAKAESNTAQKHYEELQRSIPLSPGVSDFSFPTAKPHWWYGLQELKEVSVKFK
jgi:hypothetical protein